MFMSKHKRWLLPIAFALIGVGVLVWIAWFAPQETSPVVASIPLELGYKAGYRIVKQYPHDPQAFTQGLVYADGYFYESTGLRGLSSLRKVQLENGEVILQHNLDANYFAEGLALWQDQLIQLTWQDHIGFVYERDTFALQEQFSYASEGWGLTQDGTHLIMSDGSATLAFLDPTSKVVIRSITVTDNGTPLSYINELEYIRGEIYANIWQSDQIVRIDPVSGNVLGWINLSGILPSDIPPGQVDVLNGIAYDADNDRLFVTGKLWPYLFEITLVDEPTYP